MPSRLRILFTIPNFDTAGSGKALLNIAKGLDKERFEPHIMCMHDRGAFFQVVKESGIPVHIYPYTTEMKPYWKGLRQCWKISREFKRIAPDIIHSFHYSADYSEALSAKMAGIKWVYTKKNMNWGGGSANAWKLRTWLADGIVAQNTDMLKDFFPGLKNVVLIPRGVDAKQFYPNFNSEDIRLKWGIREGTRWIICVANLNPIKGVDKLIKVFIDIANDYPEWNLLLVGDDQTEYAEQLKAGLFELQHRIIFTGKVSDVRPYLALAEVFVLPSASKGEGSPMALLEAMASGLLVIGSRVPGIKDQLKDVPELLFRPDSKDDLKQILKKALTWNMETIGFLQHRLLKVLNENFTLSKEVESHERLYFKLSNED